MGGLFHEFIHDHRGHRLSRLDAGAGLVSDEPGSLIFAIYALIIRSYPTAVMNIALVLINLRFLWKLRRDDPSYRLLRLKPELTASILEKAGQDQLKAFVSGFIANIRYQEGKVQIVTAVSYSSFTLDKSAGEIWDKAFASFLTGKKIDFDPMQ